jgi:hypothetical protein
MSAVFEFDDDDNLRPLRQDGNVTTTATTMTSLADLSLDSTNDGAYQLPTYSGPPHIGTHIHSQQPESGYSSEIDDPEPSRLRGGEQDTTVEFELGKKSFISSSVTHSSGDMSFIKNKQHKVCLDDFEIIKLLGRGA